MKLCKCVILNNKVYDMDGHTCKNLIKTIEKYALECSIYALEHKEIVEMVIKPYKSKSSLKRAIKQYENEGFKVYYKE